MPSSRGSSWLRDQAPVCYVWPALAVGLFTTNTTLGIPPASAGDARNVSSVPESGRSPGVGNGNPPTPVFLPEKFHKQRSLVGLQRVGHDWGHITHIDRTSRYYELLCLEGSIAVNLLFFLSFFSFLFFFFFWLPDLWDLSSPGLNPHPLH